MERQPEFLSAAAAVLREHAPEPAIEDFDKDFAVGIIRNEGNELNLFNVSTAAGITADAGEIKHTSPALSSPSGSADFLETLNLLLLPRHLEQLCQSGIFPSPSFLHLVTTANWHRLHHTEKHYIMPFNVLGNPAIPYRMTVGVAERELGHFTIAS